MSTVEHVQIEKPKTPQPDPYWARARLREIAYGVEMETTNPSGVTAYVTIFGTNGQTQPLALDNEPDNFLLNKKDYFVFPADDQNVGDIGIPTMILFESRSSKDGWGFKNVRVDFFSREGWNAREFTDKYKDINNRERILEVEQTNPITTINFAGRGNILDTKPGTLIGGVQWQKSTHLNAEGARLRSGSGTRSIALSHEYIIVDARNSSHAISWDSSREENVQAGEVMRALKASEHESETTNKLTIGVTTGAEVDVGPVTATAEFSVENELTVSSQRRKREENENTKNINRQYTDTTETTYTINPGDVAFFELTKTAKVKTYSDFSVLKRVNPEVEVTYHLLPTYFRTDENSGELCLLNVTFKKANEPVYSFGPELKTESRFLKAAKSAWPNFSASVARRNA